MEDVLKSASGSRHTMELSTVQILAVARCLQKFILFEKLKRQEASVHERIQTELNKWYFHQDPFLKSEFKWGSEDKNAKSVEPEVDVSEAEDSESEKA